MPLVTLFAVIPNHKTIFFLRVIIEFMLLDIYNGGIPLSTSIALQQYSLSILSWILPLILIKIIGFYRCHHHRYEVILKIIVTIGIIMIIILSLPSQHSSFQIHHCNYIIGALRHSPVHFSKY